MKAGDVTFMMLKEYIDVVQWMQRRRACLITHSTKKRSKLT
jgi:hypothetical protein